MTPIEWIEVQLEDTARVKVDGVREDDVERTKDDVRARGRSLIADGDHRGRTPPAIVQSVVRRPEALHIKDGRYALSRDGVTVSTPRDNIEGAHVGTMWTQSWGELPSLVSIVGGGVFALGFGVAGGVTLADGVRAGDDAALVEGALYTAGALAGASLLTYGVVTLVLLKRGPSWEPLPIVDDDAPARGQSRASVDSPTK